MTLRGVGCMQGALNSHVHLFLPSTKLNLPCTHWSIRRALCVIKRHCCNPRLSLTS